MHELSPQAVNVSPDRLARAVAVLQGGIDGGAMPGAVVCAYRRGQVFLHAALGTMDGTRPVTLSTLYDLASITKPMATGASVVTLLEQGKLLLGTSVGEFVDAPHLAKVTVGNLLIHTSGLPAWTPCYDTGLGLEAAVSAITHVAVHAPNTRYEYSCLNFILLQRIVERTTGTTLDTFARENVFEPLGLSDTGYVPSPTLHERIAPTISHEGPGKDTPLIGIVHDGNARGIGGVSGNAGLFSTAHDVATFGEAIRTGRTSTHRFLGAPTIIRALTSQIPPSLGGHTLLFFAHPNGLCPVGDLLSPAAVGHSGYTGTVLTIDPTQEITVAVLTNSVYDDGKVSWLQVRRKFLNALAAALE